MTWNVRFNIEGVIGNIVQVDNGLSVPMDGYDDYIVVDLDDAVATTIDCRSHYVELAGWTLAERSDEEKSRQNMPTSRDVAALVYSELSGTDQMVVPDRPMADALRDAWKAYRQSLRDLLKIAGVGEQIRAFPSRPDGIDVAADFRKRAMT